MFRLIVLFSLSLIFLAQGNFALDSEIDSHLKNSDFSKETHHDNIAEVEHTHVHKHSEDGEEHEHHHEHIGSAQSILKLNIKKTILVSNHLSIPSIPNFHYSSMSSSEFPLSIFRPPIV